MALMINSYLNSIIGNSGSSGINTNSAQYKAVERNHLSDIIANEAVMSEKERLIYEVFGGRDTIIKNMMKMYDSNGNLLNSHGVAGMYVDGKSLSERHQIIDVSEEYRQKMFDLVKSEFIQEKGIANGDTTNRSSVFTEYQLSILDSVTRESVEAALKQSGTNSVVFGELAKSEQSFRFVA